MFLIRTFRLKKKFGFTFGFLLCAFFHLQVEASQKVNLPLPEIETLPNGMEVVWFIKDSLPMIDLSIFVKAGHRDDPHGKSGTLALLSSPPWIEVQGG